MTKKLISFILILTMVIGLVPAMGSVEVFADSVTWATGEGTQQSPWVISSYSQLKSFADAVNGGNTMSGKYIKLANEFPTDSGPMSAIIGTDENAFKGFFDGHMQIINLGISVSDIQKVGLFAYVDGGSISNVCVTGNISASSIGYVVGGVVGHNNAGTINNCYSNVIINATKNNGDGLQVGGIVGYSFAAVIKNCYTSGDIIVNGTNNQGTVNVGGIVGAVGYGSVFNCYARGNVTAKNFSVFNAGGIAGKHGTDYNGPAYIKNCYATGLVNATTNGTKHVGGVVGWLYRGTLESGYSIIENVGETGVTWDTDKINCGKVTEGQISINENNSLTEKLNSYVNSHSSDELLSWVLGNGCPTFNVSHVHLWKYTSNDNVITATCVGVGSSTDDAVQQLSVISPTSLTYDGNAKLATLSEESFAGVSTLPTIYYEGISTTSYAKSASAPIDAGKYKASITVQGASASVEYTITQKEITVTPDSNQSKIYDGATTSNICFTSDGAVTGQTPAFTGSLALAGNAANAGSHGIVTNSLALTDSGSFKASNYTLSFTSGVKYTITKAAITINTAEIDDKTYDGTTAATVTSVTFDGLVNSETLVKDTDYTVSGVFDKTDAAGSNAASKVVVTVALNNTTKANNYYLSNATKDINKTINKAEQSINAPTTTNINETSVTLQAQSGFNNIEYGYSTDNNANNATWASSNLITGLTKDTSYYFFVRNQGNDNYNPATSSGIEVKTLEHAHQWTYSASGDTITATCGNTTTHDGSTTSAIKIVKPLRTTYGGAESQYATTEGSIDGVNSSEIKYYQGDTVLNAAPTDAGTYTAKITLGSATASVEYTIANASQSAPTSANATNETVKGKGDGSITGLTTDMEYKKTGESSYTAIAGTTVSNLEAGTYHVRYKAKTNYDASPDQTVTVGYAKALSVTFTSIDGTIIATSTGLSWQASVNKPADPTRASFEFSGWYVGDIKVTFPQIITDDAIYTAHWTLTATSDGAIDIGNNTSIQVDSDSNAKITGLEELAKEVKNSNSDAQVKVSLSSGKVSEGSIQADVLTAFQTVANGKKIELFDISLGKYINGTSAGAITSTGSIVIGVGIPFDSTNRQTNGVYKYHNSSVSALSLDSSKSKAKNTYYYENGYIYIYSSEFSTFAVVYTDTKNSDGGGSTGGLSSATVKTETNPVNIFIDVDKSMFCYDAVIWATKNKITSGTDETHFSPNDDTTRAQMVTFLWRAAGSPEPKLTTSKFTDVKKGSYYEKAVLWSVENGITSGVSETKFAPNESVSRAQTVTFLWRYEGNPEASIANTFTDLLEDKYFYKAVLWAKENGVTDGTAAGIFSPDSACTRGQIVTFLWRCDQK